ncbi:MAG: PepSY domain-containing protein [Pseudomonadota bacterium]
MQQRNKAAFLFASALALGLAGAAGSAYAMDGAQYSKEAKVTLDEARAIALKTIPGATITDQELEKEKGGSGLRYSFDLKVGQTEHEVGVDAQTGAVLENSVEGPNAD